MVISSSKVIKSESGAEWVRRWSCNSSIVAERGSKVGVGVESQGGGGKSAIRGMTGGS